MSSPRSVVCNVKYVCPVRASPTGADVNEIVVPRLAFARDVASLIWLSANPFAVVAATA